MESNLVELLYSAFHSEFGICVETSDAEKLRQKLYPLRKEQPELSCLAFAISPLNGVDLWIIKQRTGNAEE